MSYPIRQNGKVITMVKEHERAVRPYTKGGSWQTRLGRWIWSWLRTPVIYTLCTTIFMSYVTASFFAGELYETYHPTEKALAQVIQQKETVPPILEKIAFAETRGNQTCTDDAIAHKYCKSYQKGEVLETTNKNGTVDIGEWAINNGAYGAQATKLGYDLYTQAGNQAMAEWIFDNVGTSPWYSSEARWK